MGTEGGVGIVSEKKNSPMKNMLIPDDFIVPDILETDRFRLRMLSVDDVKLDYEAVMSSHKRLRTVFAPDDNWPVDTMTLEDNLRDLQRHQNEFLDRVAFAYTVMNLSETECLGCMYIKRSDKLRFDAGVYLWVRESEYEKGGDEELYSLVKSWIDECWPFEKVAHPGRDISWEEWERL